MNNKNVVRMFGILLLLFIIFVVSNTFAVVDTLGTGSVNSETRTVKTGMRITTNGWGITVLNVTIQNDNVSYSTPATQVYLYNATIDDNPDQMLYQDVINGQSAIVSWNLSANSRYFIYIDSNGSMYVPIFFGAGDIGGLPQARVNINYTGGSENFGVDTNTIFAILSITSENATVPCVESWINASTLCDGSNFTILYTDSNMCGTNLTLPANNGTFVNCSAPCVENWINTSTVCDGFNYTIQYADNNSCGTYVSLPVNNGTVINCTPCVESWVDNSTLCDGNNYTIKYFDGNACGTFVGLPVNNGTVVSCLNTSSDTRGSGTSSAGASKSSVEITVPEQSVLPTEPSTTGTSSQPNVLARIWGNIVSWFKGWWFG